MVQSSRAGMYANQVGGYKAFVPKPLPPDPPIQFDDEMIHLLALAERALGRLGAIGALPTLPIFHSSLRNVLYYKHARYTQPTRTNSRCC